MFLNVKYFFLACCVLIAGAVNVKAQRNFKPGYIVDLKGDTTKGVVDYKDWIQNPGNVFFKTLDNDAGKVYVPAQLKAFGVDGLESYITYTGAITTAPVKLADVKIGIDTTKEHSAVFLRTIVVGAKVTLLDYNDKIKVRFFVADGKDSPVELEQYVYMNNQGTGVIEQRDYITQLQKVAMKYEPANTKLQRRVERVSYQKSEIERIIIDVNGADGTLTNVIAKREGVKFFIGIGADFNRIALSSEMVFGRDDIFSAGTSSNSVAPTFRAGLDYYFNKNSGNLLLRTEASLSLNKISLLYTRTFTDFARTITVKENISANQAIISLNQHLLYNIVNKANVKVYVGGGFQIIKAHYSNSHYYVKYYENNALLSQNDRSVPFRGLFIHPTARVGVVLPKILELFAGYTPAVAILNATEVSAEMSTVQLGVNYHFGFK